MWPIWPWRKMGHGQPKVIIWTTLVVLPYMMLHTKFQGHWSIGSGEEDFLRFLPYMGMAAILVMWPRLFEQLFVPKVPGGCIWNLVKIGPVVSEEKSFEIVDGRRKTEPAYTISSPGAFGSGELKSKKYSGKRLIESMMGLRPRQGNVRLVFRLFSLMRTCRATDLNNLKRSLRFPCRGSPPSLTIFLTHHLFINQKPFSAQASIQAITIYMNFQLVQSC